MNDEQTSSPAGTVRQPTPLRPSLAARGASWRSRGLAIALSVATLGAGAAVANAATVSSKDGPLTASFTATTHDPSCRQKWPVMIKATYQGKPAHATAYYQFLLNGTVVNTQYPFSDTKKNPDTKAHPNGVPYHFVGSYTDNTFGPFGALAAGQTLTIRAVIHEGRYTADPSFTANIIKVSGCPVVR